MLIKEGFVGKCSLMEWQDGEDKRLGWEADSTGAAGAQSRVKREWHREQAVHMAWCKGHSRDKKNKVTETARDQASEILQSRSV